MRYRLDDVESVVYKEEKASRALEYPRLRQRLLLFGRSEGEGPGRGMSTRGECT